MTKKLTILFALVAMAVGVSSCSSIDQNQQEFNIWIKTAKRPVITKWANKVRGIQTDDYVMLLDASGKFLFLKECDMALPDTIK